MDKRIADLEERVAKLEAAAGTTAILQEQLRRNQILKRIFESVDDTKLHPAQRQDVLASLEASDCSIESLLQHH